MEPLVITPSGLADQRLVAYVSLTDHELRQSLEESDGLMVVESRFAIEVALREGVEPVSLLVDERHLDVVCAMLRSVDRPGEVPVFALGREELSKVVGFKVTRGYFCLCQRPKPLAAGEVLAGARHVAVIANVTDTSNVGAIFRSAAALGADAVAVMPTCADPWSRRAIRVSMGTVFQVPWVRLAGDGVAAVRELQAAGLSCCAMALDEGALPLGDERLRALGRLAVLFGGEGYGLGGDVVAACDAVAMIPMTNGVDSLNVAASSAVAFWELFRA